MVISGTMICEAIIMQCYAIKTQQVETDIAVYRDYDWDKFSTLNVEEKIANYLKISKMLLICRTSRHFYLKKMANHLNDDRFERRRKHFGRKILQLGELIEILECVVNQMELQIVLLE